MQSTSVRNHEEISAEWINQCPLTMDVINILENVPQTNMDKRS